MSKEQSLPSHSITHGSALFPDAYHHERLDDYVGRIVFELNSKHKDRITRKKIQKIAKEAGENPSGSDARLLTGIASEITEQVGFTVFGEQQSPLRKAVEIAKGWSEGKDTNLDTIIGDWKTFIQKAYSAQSESLSAPLVSIHDPEVQAFYLASSLMLGILHLDKRYTQPHLSKPQWHAPTGAKALSNIITTDAAKIMSRMDSSGNHQHKIYSLVRGKLKGR
jgi:hypothetical protein